MKFKDRTKGGYPVRIICTNKKTADHFPIVGLVDTNNCGYQPNEIVVYFNKRGKSTHGAVYDLIPDTKPITLRKWVTIYERTYENFEVGGIYNNKTEANNNSHLRDSLVVPIDIVFDLNDFEQNE